MQTFLPYRAFLSSARVLDNKRLGKQRVETMQIMRGLVRTQVPHFEPSPNGTIPWANHPAALMWKGYEFALMTYQNTICDEWTRRGFNDTCKEKTQHFFDVLPDELRMPHVPKWLGLKKFHSAHRANLLRKDPEYYGKFGWKEQPIEGYWWPTHNGY